ncbi:MAG TPA: PKD domain-containing protein [Thermoplasmatales archaeon]|nr:PKD domain-containing protein [Thermoplasmatales archaeon]
MSWIDKGVLILAVVLLVVGTLGKGLDTRDQGGMTADVPRVGPFTNQTEVPVWESGDFWAYRVGISYQDTGTRADLELEGLHVEVTAVNGAAYTLAFNGDVAGSVLIAGIVEGTLQDTVMEGTMVVRAEDLAVEEVTHMHIEGSIKRQLVTNGFRADLSLRQNVTPAVAPYDFPIAVGETWSVPRMTLWLYLHAQVDLAVPYTVTYDFPVYLEEHVLTCPGLEALATSVGTYGDAYRITGAGSRYDLWYSPTARNSIAVDYEGVRMWYNESLYWDLHTLEAVLLDTSYPPVNQPPAPPTRPIPANNSVNVSLRPQLQWTGSDPDGDPLTYDLFLGPDFSPPLAAENLTSPLYEPALLDADTTYYWRVVARDDHGHAASGPLWSFRTAAGDNRPPETPVRPSGPASGTVNTAYTYTSSCVDPDGDAVLYRFDWGDGSTGDWLGPLASGATVNASHSWSAVGAYVIRVQARDEHGLVSDWSEPLPVSMPKSLVGVTARCGVPLL